MSKHHNRCPVCGEIPRTRKDSGVTKGIGRKQKEIIMCLKREGLLPHIELADALGHEPTPLAVRMSSLNERGLIAIMAKDNPENKYYRRWENKSYKLTMKGHRYAKELRVQRSKRMRAKLGK